jgi:hypothetical protein
MGTFNTKIKLGNIGYVVTCNYNTYEVYIKEMEVGKVQIEQYHPKVDRYNELLYVERYMCFETGVGSGTVYTYGTSIFATREEAENIGVVKERQRLHKDIERTKIMLENRAKEKKERELRQLQELKAKYESGE